MRPGTEMTDDFRTAAESRRPRVLVIDDDRQILQFLNDALAAKGYAVETCDGGRAAVLLAQGSRFNVALCDIIMPGTGGLDVLEQLKTIDPDLEIIVMTGHGTLENAIESLRKGAFDFLQKPLTLGELFFSVKRALERRDLKERLGLFDLSRTIFSTLEPDELYGRVVQSAIQVLRGDDASLMLRDENGRLRIALSTSLQHEVLSTTHLALGERVAGRVAQQAEPVVINEDVTHDERFAGVRPWRRIRASIVCPLMMRDELIGVLNVNRVTIPEHYTEHDRRNAMILASLVALALGNALLHNELQVSLRRQRETQEEMIQAEKMTALGTLLSGVAHELNNPLCGVLGYAQLMMAEGCDPRSAKAIGVIAREAERAADIVGKLLAFARREKPEKKPLGVNGILLKTLERKSYDLKICRIDVRADLEPRLPLIMGDFHQLQSVFTDLITNAQQAMFESHGGGTLTIRTGLKGRRVVVTIADDGPGIPDESARRVFDPFFKMRRAGQRTGLGLSVCFARVRDHGGAIRVAGGDGSGATFVVELPIGPSGAQAGASGSAADASGDRADPEAASPRVLISDSEVRVQDVLVQLVRDMGWRFDTASSVEAALAKVRSEDYDALIADFSVPPGDGCFLLEAVREARPALADRIIFLSSDASDPRVRGFAQRTGRPLIGKPFDLQTVRAALRSVLAPAAPDDTTVH
ncbi:MAG: response regulator [Acidobacteriota bacterium]